MKACSDAASQGRDAEVEKQAAKIDKQIATLQDKLAREERELSQDQSELGQRKMEELGTGAENIIGLFTGSRSTRRLSSSLTKRRLTEQAKADVDESVQAIDQYKRQLNELQAERARIADDVNSRWGNVVNQITEINLSPKKTDVYVNLFGVAWTPYYLVEVGGTTLELPAFGPE
jgi:flagellar biosynthesis chaperone FliJ